MGTAIDRPLILTSREITLKKVLDLTDPQVLRTLGLAQESLTLKSPDPNAYRIPQILGHIAKEKGFEGIILLNQPAMYQGAKSCTF